MFLIEWLREYSQYRLESKAASLKMELDRIEYESNIEKNELIAKEELEQAEYVRSLEREVCQSCRTLEMQLALANQREKDLLERLINPAPAPVATTSTETFKPITGRHPFEVKRRELEANSRREAEIIKQRNIELEQLEKEMQIKIEVASESDYEKVNEVK